MVEPGRAARGAARRGSAASVTALVQAEELELGDFSIPLGGPLAVTFVPETASAEPPNGRRSRLARRSTAATSWGSLVGLRRTSLFGSRVASQSSIATLADMGGTALAAVNRLQLAIGVVIMVMTLAVMAPRCLVQESGVHWIETPLRIVALVVTSTAAMWTQAMVRDRHSLKVALSAFFNFMVQWSQSLAVVALAWGHTKTYDTLLRLVSYPFYFMTIIWLMRLTRDSVADVSRAIGLPKEAGCLVFLIRIFFLSCGGLVAVMFIKQRMGDDFVHFDICCGILCWTGTFSWVFWLVLAMLVLRSGAKLAWEAADCRDGRQAEECALAASTINFEIYACSIAVALNIVHAVGHATERGYMWPLPQCELCVSSQSWYSWIVLGNSAGNTLGALYLGGAFTRSGLAGRLRGAKEQARQRTWTEASRKSSGSSSSLWESKVHELSERGFTLKALLSFYRGLGDQYMEHFDPGQHRTVDVVRLAVIPLSAGSGSALARDMMKGEPTKPQKMVTHNWGNLFRDLVAAIVADALEEEEFNGISELLDDGDVDQLEVWCQEVGKLYTTYWVCAFSVNQHCTICGQNPQGSRDSVTGELYPLCECDVPKVSNTSEPTNDKGESIECEVNKFDDMMKLLSSADPCFEQVVAIDYEFDLFTRSWCVAELAAASEMGMLQKLKFWSEDRLNEKEGELRRLRIQDMQASRPEDTALILKKIEDVRAFNVKLQRLLFEDLLPSWGDLDAVAQIHRLARIARWQHMERKRAMLNSPSAGSVRSMMVNFTFAMTDRLSTGRRQPTTLALPSGGELN